MKLGCLSNTVDGSDETLCLKSDVKVKILPESGTNGFVGGF